MPIATSGAETEPGDAHGRGEGSDLGISAQVVRHAEDVADVVVMFGDRFYTCGRSSNLSTQPVRLTVQLGQRARASERETLWGEAV